MGTILEADETGGLHLPPSVLPHPGPHRRYRVATEDGQVVVDQVPAEPVPAKTDREAWLQDLARRRARGKTIHAGIPLQQIFDDLREDRR